MPDSLPTQDRAAYVRGIFRRIAPRYDMMNRLMTGGQDVQWRRSVIERADLPVDRSVRLLDLGAGTGDLSREAIRQSPEVKVLAADFTLEMMLAGKNSSKNSTAETHPIDWSAADALNLPFPDGTFDAVVSGYLLRNVTDIQQALREQYRVLKPGGRFVSLDTTRPVKNFLTPFIKFHMHVVIPALGWLLTGQRDAYTYLPDSSEAFLRAEELAARLAAAGFKQVVYERRMFGTMAIHWGKK